MNTDEFRDLLRERTEPAQDRPAPVPALRRRVRRARARRAAAAATAMTAAAALAVTVLPGSDGGPVLGPSTRATTPEDRIKVMNEITKNDWSRLQMSSRYFWVRLPGDYGSLTWPAERSLQVTYQVKPGVKAALYSGCDGFESNVNIKMTLGGGVKFTGAGSSEGFNCFDGGIWELTVPAGTTEITVDVVALQYAEGQHPKWPPSRTRTWKFGFYEQTAEKVPTGFKAKPKLLPRKLARVDQNEAQAKFNALVQERLGRP